MGHISLWAERTIKISFYLLFFITPFIFNPGNSELFELPKMYFIFFCTIIILTTWLTRSVLTGTFIFKGTFLDIPLLLFSVHSLLPPIFQSTSILQSSATIRESMAASYL